MSKTASSPVAIDPTTYQRISHYAEVVGKPIKQVIDKALNRWMDDFGDVVLESYAEMAARKAKKSPIKRKIGNAIVFINQEEAGIPIMPQAVAQGRP